MSEPYYIILDPLGSFRTADGRFDAICWTHRGGGWDVLDSTTRRHWYAPNGRTARQLVRTLLRDGNPYDLDRVI